MWVDFSRSIAEGALVKDYKEAIQNSSGTLDAQLDASGKSL
jgi:hypothetical protein